MDEASLLSWFGHHFPGSVLVRPGPVKDIVAAPGAYALVLRLARPLPVERPGMSGMLAPGRYVYAGSARGGGGIRARLGRHFRKDKPIHWHVDQITAVADTMLALAIPDGSECAIVERLMQSNKFHVPMRGFGSSDCRACPAHLLVRKEELS